MAGKDVVVQVDTKKLDAIIKNLDGNVSDAVRIIAFSIERQAKINATPFVDTGALRASIYTVIGDGKYDGYSESSADARSRNQSVSTHPLPKPENAQTAHVGPSTDYALYVELGTTRMDKRPFLGNAVHSIENDIADKFTGAVTDGE